MTQFKNSTVDECCSITRNLYPAQGYEIFGNGSIRRKKIENDRALLVLHE